MKLKSKIVILIEKNGEHVDRPWVERIAPEAWHPYNDTYGTGRCPAPGSYAEYCGKTHGGDPGFMRLCDGMLLETSDSVFDRMLCRMQDFVSGPEAEKMVKRMNDAYDSVTEAGQTASAAVRCSDVPGHAFDFKVVGSGDFLDLDDQTKRYMSEKWYRAWYDENKKRGLADFEYSFPGPNETNRGHFGEDVDVLLDMYDRRSDSEKKLSFREWLSAGYNA